MNKKSFPSPHATETPNFDALSPANSVFAQNSAPHFWAVQKGLGILQINLLIGLSMTYIGRIFDLNSLVAFESQSWHLWAFLGNLCLAKFAALVFFKSRASSLKLVWGIDLLFTALLGLLATLILSIASSEALRTAIVGFRVMILACLSGLTAFQLFLCTQVRLTIVTLALVLSCMALFQVVCLGIVAHLSERFRLTVQGTFFGVLLLAFFNTYIVLIAQFLERSQTPSKKALDVVNVYCRIQSDWTRQFWLDFCRMMSVGTDLACHDPAKNEQAQPPKAFESQLTKETADRVDLSEEDLEDKLSVSAMY